MLLIQNFEYILYYIMANYTIDSRIFFFDTFKIINIRKDVSNMAD